MRRRIALAILLFCLGVGQGAFGEAKRVLLWHSYRATERLALEEVVTQFNAGEGKGLGLEIKLLAIPYDAFADKITAAIPRGHGPDLFIFAHDRVGDWARGGHIEPIEFWVDEEMLDQFFESTVYALAYGDSLYGLPVAFKSTVLFYNKALIPQPPRTTEEMIDLAKGVTNRAEGRFGLVYENTNFYHHGAWIFGLDGCIFDQSGELCLTRPGTAASFAFARDLAAKEGIVPEESTSILVTTLFNEGKAAMVINGPWFLGEIEGKVDYGVAVLPVVSQTGLPAKPFMGSEGIMMSAKCRDKKAAFTVMRYLTGLESARMRLLKGRQTVANRAVYELPEVKGDPVIRVFHQQLAQTVPMANTPEMRMVWGPIGTALSNVVNNGQDPAAQIAEAQRRIQSFIDSSRAKP